MSKQRRALGGVTPNSTITNRRNGFVTHFGPRRAFDGAYVGEVIAASGCSADDIARLIYCLQPLAENNLGNWTVDDLLSVSVLLREDQSREEKDAILRQFKTAAEARKLGLRVISNSDTNGDGRHE